MLGHELGTEYNPIYDTVLRLIDMERTSFQARREDTAAPHLKASHGRTKRRGPILTRMITNLDARRQSMW